MKIDWSDVEALVKYPTEEILPSVEELFNLFTPDFDTGVLYSQLINTRRLPDGRPSGYVNDAHAPKVRVNGRNVNVRDVLYKMYHGVESRRVFNLNRDIHDNRITNLDCREAAASRMGEELDIPDCLSLDEKPNYSKTDFLPLPPLGELFYYFTPDYDKGILYWRILPPRSKKKPGDVAGRCTVQGIWKVKLNQQEYGRRRIIFKMYHKREPGMVYSENTLPGDDRISNLVEGDCDQVQLNENRKISRRKSSDAVRGVSWNKTIKMWCVNIRHDNESYYFGRFKDREKAESTAIEFRKAVIEVVKSGGDKTILRNMAKAIYNESQQRLV